MGRFGRGRSYDTKTENKTIFIFCEGEQTEPLYFEGFKKDVKKEIRKKSLRRAEIIIKGAGRTPLSLVKFANETIEDYNPDVDEKWLVFDEDTRKGGEFDNTIKKAKADKWKVACSNECFELWYLLHFSYYNTGNRRKAYFKKLDELAKSNPKLNFRNWEKYGKSFDGMYSALKEKQKTAIKNSKKLIASYRGSNLPPSNQKPSTKVHLLVESLNKLMR